MRARPAALLALLPICMLAMLSSDCAHAQAKTTADAPPLTVPPPPPRVVETVDGQVPQPVGLVEEPARNPPARPQPVQTVTPRVDAPRPTEPRVETPAGVDVLKPADEPRASPLQTTPAQQEGEVEARIRGVMARATNDLNRINYQALGADARTQYDTAKGFIRQADDALRARNLAFAGSLADKAATLAAQLSGR